MEVALSFTASGSLADSSSNYVHSLKLSLVLLHGFAAFGLQQSLLVFPVHHFG